VITTVVAALSVLLSFLGMGKLAAAAAAPAAPGSAAQEALAATERAFAQAAAAQGVKEAFLAYLADDAVLFRPRPVPGRAWMRDHPAPAIRLAWSPSFVQVSQAGDLGYTTGPYEVRSTDPKDGEVDYGRFVTVWRRQQDGPWRVALDIGVPAPQSLSPAGAAVEHGRPLVAASSGGAAADRESLLAADRALAAAVAAQGAPAAYAGRLGEGARLLRQGQAPAMGAAAIRAALATRPSKLAWPSAEGEVAVSGDLGYTHGIATYELAPGAPAQSAGFLRLWERAPGGEWKIALDLLSRLPPLPPPVEGGTR
jgi:ketosteroid isomerase-like protein